MPLDDGYELDLNTRVSIVLAEAADLIERNGWCQGKAFEGKAFCAFGAIRSIARRHAWEPDVPPAMARLEIHISGAWSHNAVAWNDRLPPDTGKETVVHTLRRASGLEK